FAQQHRTHLIFLEVHGDPRNAVAELDQFARHNLIEAVYARNAVPDRDDGPDLAHVDGAVVVLDLLPEYCCDLVCPDLSHIIPNERISLIKYQALPHGSDLAAHGPVVNFGTQPRGGA